jgi:hypothetical protein
LRRRVRFAEQISTLPKTSNGAGVPDIPLPQAL